MAVFSQANPGLVLPSGKPNPYQKPKPAASPWGSIDPSKPLTGNYSGTVDQAWQGLDYAAQQGWGRGLDDEMKKKIAANAQAKGWKGGAVDQTHYNEALSFMSGQLGAKPGDQPNAGGQTPPELGIDPAIEQWKKQAPVVGVPSNFRNANPYYAQQQQLMGKILQNPETMGQQWQDRQNEAQKESAIRMQQQMQQQGGQALAGRGFGQGGQDRQFQNQNQQQMMQQILSGRRDTAQQAAVQNRQDQYNALNQSGQMADQELGFDMQRAGMGLGQINQNRQSNLQEWLGKHSADMDVLGFEENKDQFNKGFGLDFLRYMAQRDQFGQSLGENQRQHNNQMGFNWAGLNAQQQQQMMNTIMGWF